MNSHRIIYSIMAALLSIPLNLHAAGQIGVMRANTGTPLYLKGGDGIDITTAGEIKATGIPAGGVSNTTFTNYTSSQNDVNASQTAAISAAAGVAGSALQPGDARLWVDASGYHRMPNRTDSGNTVMRVYDDGGAVQIGTPARAQGLGADVAAGAAQQFKVGHGSTGTPSTVIAPVAYVEKVTGASTATGSYDTSFQALNYRTSGSNANMQAITGTVQHQFGGTGDTEAILGVAYGSAAGQSGSSIWGLWGFAHSGAGDYIGATGGEFNVVNEHAGGNYGLHMLNYLAAGTPRGYTRGVTIATEGANDITQGLLIGTTNTSDAARWKTGLYMDKDAVKDFDGTYNEMVRMRGTSAGAGTGPQGIVLTDKLESGIDTSGATIVGNKAIKLAPSHVITDGTNTATAAQLRDATKIQGADIPAPVSGDNAKFIQYNSTSGDFQYAASGGTPGGSSGQIQYNNAGSFAGATSLVDANGIAIGVNTTANGPLTIYGASAATVNGIYASRSNADVTTGNRYNGMAVGHTVSATSPHASSSMSGLDITSFYSGAGTLPKLIGQYITGRNTGASSVTTNLIGQEVEMRVSSTGTAGNMYGSRIATPTNAGTVSTAITGVSVANQVPSGGNTIPTTYGLRVEDQTGVKSTTPYSIYTGTGLVRFGDSVSTTGSLTVTGAATTKTIATTVPVATTYGATTTVDLSAGHYPKVTLTGNTTLAFSNPVAGQAHKFRIKQDATGGRTVTWPSTGLVCTWLDTSNLETATAPAINTAANSVTEFIIVTTSTTTADCYKR